MIDSEGRLFGRINVLDLLAAVVIVGALVGFGLAKAGHAGVHAKIRGNAVAEVDCLIRGIVEHPNSLVKKGDMTFITLRNVPYSAVLVTGVQTTPELVPVPQPDGTVKALPDPSDPFGHNILITIREKAHLTDDGVVFGDSKVKVGTPIDLEGYRYRLHGVVADVRILPATASTATGT